MERETVTGNGVTVRWYENPSLHGFYLSLFVRSGSVYEDAGNNGITHFLEHIAIRNLNVARGGELYGLLDRTGLEFNACTYGDVMQFYVSGAKENFAVGAEILSELFGTIRLPKSEIDVERNRIKAEIREGDERNTMANFAATVLYPDTPVRFPITGTLSAVNAVTGKALEEYRKRLFVSGNVFFYATGGVSEEDVAVLCRAIEAKEIAPGNALPFPDCRPAAFGKRNAAVAVKAADYTLVRFNFDVDLKEITPAEFDLLYDMLLSGYDSAFFIEMSEKRGLFYDLTGSAERYGDVGLLQFSYEVRGNRLEEAVENTVRILREIKASDCRKSQDMKAAYVVNSGLLLDDAQELNFTFGYDVHVLGAPYASVEERKAAYEAVGSERIRELAGRIFTADRLTLTVKGDRKRVPAGRLHEILRTL